MSDAKKKQILIVDDERDICILLGKLLRNAGYDTICAQDGREALKRIRKETPDLLILDLLMPELSGYAVLDILKAKKSRIPVLVVSAVSDVAENLADQRIAGVLLKPIDSEKLLNHIEAIFKIDRAAASIRTSIPELWQEQERSLDETSWPSDKEPLQHPPEPPPEAAPESKSEPTPEPKAAAAVKEDEGAGPRPLVLIVDDEVDLLRSLAELLQFKGFDVITAEDGQQGLTLAQQLIPNAIILDVMLPKMDGFQVCRLLKFNEKYRDIPIIILTARNEESGRELAQASGAEAFIAKPFDTDELINTLHRIVTKPSERKAAQAKPQEA